MSRRNLLVATALLAAAAPATAVTVEWASLTGFTTTSVTGTIGKVGVRFDGPHNTSFTQVNNTFGPSFAIDPWQDNGYTQGLVNRPPTIDFIALDVGGEKTITFTAPVKDVYLALASWNLPGPTLFSAPFTIVTQGQGRYGRGVFTPNAAGDGFGPAGEATAVLKFAGTFTALSFTDRTENYHAMTIGFGSAAPTGGVPEPASWALLVAGFGLTGAMLRRRARIAA